VQSLCAATAVLPISCAANITELLCVANSEKCSADGRLMIKSGDAIRLPAIETRAFHSHRAVYIDDFRLSSDRSGDDAEGCRVNPLQQSRVPHKTGPGGSTGPNDVPMNVAFAVGQLTGEAPTVHLQELYKLNPSYAGESILNEQHGTYHRRLHPRLCCSIVPMPSGPEPDPLPTHPAGMSKNTPDVPSHLL
jgi:hypothetical protein